MTTKRGSKLNKSETVQVRFDPILKMAAELASGKERRSLSSFIEWAVELAAKQVTVGRNDEGHSVDAYQAARECWDPEPGFRIGNLSRKYPDLLTIREQKIVSAKHRLFDADAGGLYLKLHAGGEVWEDLCRYADDEITFEELAIRADRLRKSLVKRMEAAA